MAIEPTAVQKIEFRKAFSKFDKDGNGQISADELTEVLKNLAVPMTNEQIQDMLKQVDSDNSGTIEFDEFCSYMMKKLNKAKQPPNIDELRKRVFKACDRDGSGKVGADELVEIMDIVGGGRIDLSEAKRLIEKYDTDGDSQITYDEFVVLLSK